MSLLEPDIQPEIPAFEGKPVSATKLKIWGGNGRVAPVSRDAVPITDDVITRTTGAYSLITLEPLGRGLERGARIHELLVQRPGRRVDEVRRTGVVELWVEADRRDVVTRRSHQDLAADDGDRGAELVTG